MRISSWGTRSVLAVCTAMAAALLGSPLASADTTVAMDPPADPGDGSLPDGYALTAFDVPTPPSAGSIRRC